MSSDGARTLTLYEVPEGYEPQECSCGVLLCFVTTKKGKSMPVNPKIGVTYDGVRYGLPHWVDCPDREMFKDLRKAAKK